MALTLRRPCRAVAWETLIGKSNLVPLERVQSAILIVRGHKVMLDAAPAALYTGHIQPTPPSMVQSPHVQ
jgi:hypothetical protein